jgi:hypothetical protein
LLWLARMGLDFVVWDDTANVDCSITSGHYQSINQASNQSLPTLQLAIPQWVSLTSSSLTCFQFLSGAFFLHHPTQRLSPSPLLLLLHSTYLSLIAAAAGSLSYPNTMHSAESSVLQRETRENPTMHACIPHDDLDARDKAVFFHVRCSLICILQPASLDECIFRKRFQPSMGCPAIYKDIYISATNIRPCGTCQLQNHALYLALAYPALALFLSIYW